MFRAGKRAGKLAAGLAGLVALALLAPGVAAGVAAAATQGGGPVGLAALLTPPKTFTSQYSCDLSPYGSAIAPVKVSATLEFPPAAQAQRPFGLTLKTTSAALPSAVLSKLNGVVSFDLAATVAASQYGITGSAALSGTAPVHGQLTGLPVGTATGSVSLSSGVTGFPTGGKGQIIVPAQELTFTPRTASSALHAISCTTTAGRQTISVTVAPAVIGKSGPLYRCVASGSARGTVLAHVPMTVTMSGSRTTDKTDTVTLVADGIGPAGAQGATSFGFSAELSVRGAQQGRVALAETTRDLTSSSVTVSGKLRLTKSGTDQILVPQQFKLTLNFPAPVGAAVVTCALTVRQVPVGLRFTVTQAHPQPSTSPTPTGNGGQPQGSGTPSGAPNTGGGIGGSGGSGGDLAVVAGGMALVLSGGGLVIAGRRRRNGS
jgi:hypothetical protein